MIDKTLLREAALMPYGYCMYTACHWYLTNEHWQVPFQAGAHIFQWDSIQVSLFNANICRFRRCNHRRAAVHLWFYQQRSRYPSTWLSGHKCKWIWWPCHPSRDMDVQLHLTFATTWTAVYVDACNLTHQVLNRSGGFLCRFGYAHKLTDCSQIRRPVAVG